MDGTAAEQGRTRRKRGEGGEEPNVKREAESARRVHHRATTDCSLASPSLSFNRCHKSSPCDRHPADATRSRPQSGPRAGLGSGEVARIQAGLREDSTGIKRGGGKGFPREHDKRRDERQGCQRTLLERLGDDVDGDKSIPIANYISLSLCSGLAGQSECGM